MRPSGKDLCGDMGCSRLESQQGQPKRKKKKKKKKFPVKYIYIGARLVCFGLVGRDTVGKVRN